MVSLSGKAPNTCVPPRRRHRPLVRHRLQPVYLLGSGQAFEEPRLLTARRSFRVLAVAASREVEQDFGSGHPEWIAATPVAKIVPAAHSARAFVLVQANVDLRPQVHASVYRAFEFDWPHHHEHEGRLQTRG